MSLEEKLQQLRDEWVKRPDKRSFIEKQATLIKRVMSRIPNQDTKPAPGNWDAETTATFAYAQEIFAPKVGVANTT